MIPKVSILVPVYNASQWLRQCINSIVGQTYRCLQVVLVDDGSTDDSLAICKEYAEQYPFVEVYHQENSGVATTRNTLLDKASGDYVLFVDADDWIELNTVEFLVSATLRTDANMVTCAKYVQGATMEIFENIWSQDKAVYEFLRHVSFNGSLWNKLLKRELLKDLRFDERISYGEDALLIWYFLQRSNKVVITNKELYHHLVDTKSLMYLTLSIKY